MCESISKGIEYKNGVLVHNLEKEVEDENVPADKRTMSVVQSVANDICHMITMTVDVPSEYEDSKVPMLDLKVWLEEEDKQCIYYMFYEKPTKHS